MTVITHVYICCSRMYVVRDRNVHATTAKHERHHQQRFPRILQVNIHTCIICLHQILVIILIFYHAIEPTPLWYVVVVNFEQPYHIRQLQNVQ